MPEITLRPLAATDREDWARLWTGYLDYYETSVPSAVYDSTFARLLGDDPRTLATISVRLLSCLLYTF